MLAVEIDIIDLGVRYGGHIQEVKREGFKASAQLQFCRIVKASLVRIQLPPQGSTVILCSPMVRISLFHREDRGSIPRIGIMGARNINNKDCLHIR